MFCVMVVMVAVMPFILLLFSSFLIAKRERLRVRGRTAKAPELSQHKTLTDIN